MRIIVATSLALTFSTVMSARETPTWSRDVAPIIYRACVSCHHTGGIAPFPLTTFEEVMSMAQAVNEAVVTRTMPPYPADLTYRRYAHERALSNDEITAITEWVAMGTPAGDLTQAPPPPRFDDGPALKSPDLVVTMPRYTSKAANNDVYRCFTMPTNESVDRYIDAIEIVPGNSSIVHHVLVFIDTASTTAALDAQDQEPGYVGFGGVGSTTAELAAVWAPGATPTVFPSGFGIRLPKRARVIFQMHYPAGTQGETDATSIRLRYATHPAVRPVMISAVLNHENIVNKPFRIPANQVKTFRQQYTVPADVSVLAVAPHMHLLGKSAKVWVRTPASDTIPIISIPHWDFHWQIAYVFPTMLRITKGSVLESQFTYDNTSLNEHNPSTPPADVQRGESTTDEMMLTFFYYALYRPGDENIRLDVALTPTSASSDTDAGSSWSAMPNPTTGTAWIRGVRVQGQQASIRVVDAMGRIVFTDTRDALQDASVTIPVPGLTSGAYNVIVTDGPSMQTIPLRVLK
ncbi:MAG: hypothetical protein FGM24_02920 [Candidatus Kapabacteria bacterium]|nr:hypothetical protein [Candidatus Kapabacteria bacterium]